MSRRRMMFKKSELLDGYKRCEYLESTGAQWIDTGVKAHCKLSFSIYAKFKNNVSVMLFGARERFAVKQFTINTGERGLLWSAYDSDVQKTSYITDTTNWHEYERKTKSLYVDKKLIHTNSSSTAVSKLNLYLFCCNENNKGIYYASAYITKFRCYDSDELVRNLIPSLDPSGRPCMYDTVTQQPFYNQGTGEFGYELMDGTYVAPV